MFRKKVNIYKYAKGYDIYYKGLHMQVANREVNDNIHITNLQAYLNSTMFPQIKDTDTNYIIKCFKKYLAKQIKNEGKRR